jgi:hypothetical protein
MTKMNFVDRQNIDAEKEARTANIGLAIWRLKC